MSHMTLPSTLNITIQIEAVSQPNLYSANFSDQREDAHKRIHPFGVEKARGLQVLTTIGRSSLCHPDIEEETPNFR